MSELDAAMAALVRPGEVCVWEGDLSAWWARTQRALGAHALAVDGVLHEASRADRLGAAFGVGYLAALRALFGGFAGEGLCALCVTEKGSTRPKDLRTLLRSEGDGLVLDGEKSFVTFGTHAERYLVAAIEAGSEGVSPRVRVVRVRAGTAGVSVSPKGAAPIAPEIPHAAVRFEGVRVAREDVLEGDGYARAVKPFRTVEDLHVLAAATAYLAGVTARAAWTHEAREELFALALATRSLALMSPYETATHLALAGCFATLRGWLARNEAQWAKCAPEERERWVRDAALLLVAERAREARRAGAWTRLEGARANDEG